MYSVKQVSFEPFLHMPATVIGAGTTAEIKTRSLQGFQATKREIKIKGNERINFQGVLGEHKMGT